MRTFEVVARVGGVAWRGKVRAGTQSEAIDLVRGMFRVPVSQVLVRNGAQVAYAANGPAVSSNNDGE